MRRSFARWRSLAGNLPRTLLVLIGLLCMTTGVLIAQEASDPPAEAEASAERPGVVTVDLASGRRFAGFVDPRTSDAELHLRFDHDGASLRRPIAWPRVVRVRAGDREYSAAEFRAAARQFVTPPPKVLPPPATDDGRVVPTALPEVVVSKPVSLSADAWTANFDRDAEDDGIVVQLLPLDEFGRLAPTSGTLRVELIAKSGVRRPTTAISSRGPDVQRPVIESWTVQLTGTEFGHSGALVRLPYASENPADNPHLRSLGAVRISFAVPGVEMLEAIVDPVRLRPVWTIGTVGR